MVAGDISAYSNSDIEDNSLIYAIILEQLEADGLSLVRNILEDEYSSQFGSHEASELESTIATLETTIPGQRIGSFRSIAHCT